MISIANRYYLKIYKLIEIKKKNWMICKKPWTLSEKWFASFEFHEIIIIIKYFS